MIVLIRPACAPFEAAVRPAIETGMSPANIGDQPLPSTCANRPTCLATAPPRWCRCGSRWRTLRSRRLCAHVRFIPTPIASKVYATAIGPIAEMTDLPLSGNHDCTLGSCAAQCDPPRRGARSPAPQRYRGPIPADCCPRHSSDHRLESGHLCRRSDSGGKRNRSLGGRYVSARTEQR